MLYSEDDYLGFNPFDGDKDDCGARARSVKLVKVRKEQQCMLSSNEHTIKPGEFARFEKAVVDEKWASYYCCLECMDDWFQEIGLE